MLTLTRLGQMHWALAVIHRHRPSHHPPHRLLSAFQPRYRLAPPAAFLQRLPRPSPALPCSLARAARCLELPRLCWLLRSELLRPGP